MRFLSSRVRRDRTVPLHRRKWRRVDGLRAARPQHRGRALLERTVVTQASQAKRAFLFPHCLVNRRKTYALSYDVERGPSFHISRLASSLLACIVFPTSRSYLTS